MIPRHSRQVSRISADRARHPGITRWRAGKGQVGSARRRTGFSTRNGGDAGRSCTESTFEIGRKHIDRTFINFGLGPCIGVWGSRYKPRSAVRAGRNGADADHGPAARPARLPVRCPSVPHAPRGPGGNPPCRSRMVLHEPDRTYPSSSPHRPGHRPRRVRDLRAAGHGEGRGACRRAAASRRERARGPPRPERPVPVRCRRRAGRRGSSSERPGAHRSRSRRQYRWPGRGTRRSGPCRLTARPPGCGRLVLAEPAALGHCLARATIDHRPAGVRP